MGGEGAEKVWIKRWVALVMLIALIVVYACEVSYRVLLTAHLIIVGTMEEQTTRQHQLPGARV